MFERYEIDKLYDAIVKDYIVIEAKIINGVQQIEGLELDEYATICYVDGDTITDIRHPERRLDGKTINPGRHVFEVTELKELSLKTKPNETGKVGKQKALRISKREIKGSHR